MNFQTKLNELIETIGCNSKELSNASNISTSVISRYRSGERTPKHNSDKFNKLIDGLSILAKKNNIKKLNKKKITDLLESTLHKENIDIELFKNNLNILINTLNINVSEMAKYIGFDSSYISKIRNGKRQPQNIYEFSLTICKYIINKYNDTNSIIIIEQLINKKIDNNNYLNILHNWICNNINEENNIIDSFLTKLD